MAPSEKQIIAEIHTVIRQVYSDPLDRENLTVRHVRDLVEPRLGLEKGFLTQAQWKEKSKKIIKEYAEELIAQQEAEEDSITTTIQVKPEVEEKPIPTPTPTKAAPVKKNEKRASQESKPPPRKRQKKEQTPSEDEVSELSEPSPEESDESEFGKDSDAPKRKRNSKSKSKTPVKRQFKKKADSESEKDDDHLSDDSSTKRKSKSKKQASTKRQSKSSAKVESSGDEEKEEDSPKKPIPKKIPAKNVTPKKVPTSKIESSPNDKVTPKKEVSRDQFKKAPSSDAQNNAKPKPAAGAASDSEMSTVIDATPKPKRNRRSKSDMSEPASKPAKSSTAKPGRPKPTKDLTPDEVQIKTLQSQLKKCGMTKIWQFELKQYGDDSKEKIRHLQGVLREIGMTGRFSEARAREIKEMRELQADLEAVREGEKSWGLGGGKRASRGKVGKSFRESSGSGDDEEDKGKEGDGCERENEGKKRRSSSRSESEHPVDRKPRARADLAFLDDEEESD